MKLALISIAVLLVLIAAYLAYAALIVNPRVERELRENPDGERARKVMLIKLPSGRIIPVNYLREDDVVYAGADGRWWHELRGPGARVELLIRGQTLSGVARAVEDDPPIARTCSVVCGRRHRSSPARWCRSISRRPVRSRIQRVGTQ